MYTINYFWPLTPLPLLFTPSPMTFAPTTAPLPHSLGYSNPMADEAVPEEYLNPVLSTKADYGMDTKPPQEYLTPDAHEYMPMDNEPGKQRLHYMATRLPSLYKRTC